MTMVLSKSKEPKSTTSKNKAPAKKKNGTIRSRTIHKSETSITTVTSIHDDFEDDDDDFEDTPVRVVRQSARSRGKRPIDFIDDEDEDDDGVEGVAGDLTLEQQKCNKDLLEIRRKVREIVYRLAFIDICLYARGDLTACS